MSDYDDIVILIVCIYMWLIAVLTLLMALSHSPMFIVATIMIGSVATMLTIGLRENSDILG